jgi:heavy metal sensor kinase
MSLSIRWRLTLWNTLGLAVVLIGFSALVYFLLARTLYQRIDWLLLHELRELEHDPGMTSDRHARLAYWIEEFREHEKILCVVYDSKGHVFELPEVLAADSVPPAPPSATSSPVFHDTTLPILGRQRLLTGRVNLGGEDYTVLFMAGLEETDLELSRLLVVLATAVPITLLLGAFLAYGLARKALAPVAQLNRLTEQITAERLDRRLPVVNPGDELGHLAKTINAMIARLEKSFSEIRRFTADASHELRTPLTAIRVEAEVALAKPLTTEEYQQLLGSILEECERLARLTDQLLSLAREDAGAVLQAKVKVDVGGLIQSVVDNMRPLAETRKLRLEGCVEESLTLLGDAPRLRQVFYNLVDNALKFTPEGGAVTVTADRRDGTVVITVCDTGAGIAPEDLPRVFDRFYRADKARSREQGGTGLGLSIARSIVTAHGGKIELASTVGKGTVCSVVLPSDAAPVKEGRERK